MGRHRISSDTRERRGQFTVAELEAKIQRTTAEAEAEIEAKQHITDVQTLLDDEQAS